MKTPAQRMAEIETVRPPAQIASFAEVLGNDLTVEFLLAFGGSAIHLSERPQDGSLLTDVLTVEQISALAKATGGGFMRVPTSKPFICAHLRAKGMSVNAIARKLHVTTPTVRAMLLREVDRLQLSLFE